MSCGNAMDLRRVGIEHASESWENETSGTGAPTPARTDRDLLYERRAAAVDATHARPVCEPSRAVRHTGGTDLPHIKLVWAREPRAIRAGGIVYYLERSDGAVKIGCTSNYPRRREALLRQHGPLRLVAWEPGYHELEQQRHQQFAHARIDPAAEWFRVDADLLDHVLSLLAVL